MTIKLRPYQEQLIVDVRQAFRQNKAVLLVLATGGGKTVTFSEMIRRALGKKNRTWAMCHRQELVNQIGGTLRRFEIPHGYIAAGSHPDPFRDVQVCSIMTLARRYLRLQPPKIVIVDEAHHSASSTWQALIKWVLDNGGMVLGVTATPERLDGRGLDNIYTAMVQGPTTGQLIDEGFLCGYKIFAPTSADLSGVRTRAGDYAKDDLVLAMDKPTIFGDIINHYRRLAPGKRAVGFYVSVEVSQRMVDSFNAAGIPSAHIDGETPKEIREELVAKFAAGEILHLGNVDLFGEGFDVPAIEAVIMARPTQSVTLYLQQVGRGLRPVYADGFDLETKEGRLAAIAASAKPRAIILDHASNALRHGLPDDERAWSLKGRVKKKGNKDNGPPVKQCPTCYAVLPAAAPVCTECGHEFGTGGREVAQVEGELVEFTRERKRVENKELSAAKTEGDLIALAIKRGHPNPQAYANAIMHTRRKWEETR